MNNQHSNSAPTSADKQQAKKQSPSRSFSLFKPRFSTNEQMLFAKRLSFLLGAGVSVIESLHMLKDQTRSRRAVRLYEEVIVNTANGQFLSKSLAQFDRCFSKFAVSIINIGEQTGNLASNLVYLAEELQKKVALRKKVIGALVYPIIVTLATLGICVMLTVYIFPKIMPIFSSLDVELPLTTRILLSISNFLQSYGIYLGIGIIILVTAIGLMWRHVTPVKAFLDRLILKVPITGTITLYYNMSNLTRTLGLLLRSGVPLALALETAGDTMNNLTYKRECERMAKGVVEGKQLSEMMMEGKGKFPSMMSNLINVGEKTGKLSDTLMYLSELYESEVDDLTKNMSSAIEPVLMIVMGLLVGFIAVSVITPIYEITQNLQP